MALLEVKDLYKEFSNGKEKIVAVDRVSFTLEKGECLGIVGESGCGKSTMASLLVHLNRADGGQIIFDGKDLNDQRAIRESRRNMQMIFQNPTDSFDPRDTLLKGIKQGLRYFWNPGREELDRRAKQAMDEVGLKESYEHRKIHQLSGGECQRAAVARAIVSEPKLVICDEVTSALDVSVQAQVIELLKRLQKEKQLSYLFITHDLLLARNMCDRIAVMYRGSIVEIGTAEEMMDHPRHPYTKLLLSCVLQPKAEKKMKFINCESVRNPAPSGCKFYEYCPYGSPRCSEKKPVLEEKQGRKIACFL